MDVIAKKGETHQRLKGTIIGYATLAIFFIVSLLIPMIFEVNGFVSTLRKSNFLPELPPDIPGNERVR